MRNGSWWWWTAFILIVLTALALRLQKLSRISLTNDEVAEVTWAAMPFGDMIDRVALDVVHPPLDYIVQFALGRAGASEPVRRLPAVLFGTATVALVILLGRLWYGPLAGLLAGCFLTISPMHIRFSQEIRPYSMALFFVVGAILCLELYATRRRVIWAVLWFVAVLFAGYTFYFAGMTAGVVSLARIYVDRRGSLGHLWEWMTLLIAGWAVLYAAWVPVAIHGLRTPRGFRADTLDWPWWRYRLHVFGAGQLSENAMTAGSWAFWCAVVVGIVLSIRVKALRFAVIWLIGCGAIEIITLHFRPHYSAARHLMPAWIGAFILAGAGVAFLFRRVSTTPVAAAIILLFGMYSGIVIADYYRGGRSDWRHVAVFVHDRIQPGDTLIAANEWTARNLGYYWERLPPIPGATTQRFKTSATPRPGPIWIVTAQCMPRDRLKQEVLVRRFPETDGAEVRLVRAGETLDVSEELCPE